MNLLSRPDIPLLPMTIDQFFDWYELQERKYELVDGVPELQPFVKRNHSRVTTNFVAAFLRQIDLARYEIATGDFAVPTGPRSIRFADVMVELAGGDDEGRTTEQPVVLVEVLSPSTRRTTFGRKAQEYLALPSLDTYLIVEQKKRQAWQWTRDERGNWPDQPLVLDAPDAIIAIAAIGFRVGFNEIFRNVPPA